MQRDYLAQQLGVHKSKVSDITLELTNSMKLDLLSPMDEISKKLEKMTDRIRYADYGYAGFFDAVKINEAELAKIYEFDLSLVEYVQSIGESLNVIENGVDSEEEDGKLKSKIKTLHKTLTEFDNRFNDREHIITGVKE